MKKETLKEFGKLFYDFAKIILAITLITPLANGKDISVYVIAVVAVLIAIGTYLLNKGAKDD